MANVSEIVGKNLCSGCGVCAAVCPVSAIKIQFNSAGEYQPYISSMCNQCGLCLKVCPFFDPNPNEDDISKQKFGDVDEIRHSQHTGYYASSFVGYSKKYREISASGGLLTWLLVRLLESKQIDGVACVVPATGEKLFEYKLCRTVSEIEAAAGSAYYPVEISKMLRLIKQREGRYAVVCLPCVGKALRLACLRDNELQNRITYLLGLVCGQTKSSLFSEFCAAVSGGDVSRLTGIKFRVKDSKDLSKMGYNCAFSYDKSNIQHPVRGWQNGFGLMWNNFAFTLNACLFCDDVFAETADAAFMDAWLPAYSKDYLGTNIALVRKSEINDILQSGIIDKSLILHSIPIADILKSQWAQLLNKRRLIRARLHWTIESCSIPRKRSHLLSWPALLACLKEKRRMSVRECSSGLWRSRSNLTGFIAAIRSRERLACGVDLFSDGLGLVLRKLRRAMI